jgi:hypothetical protein
MTIAENLVRATNSIVGKFQMSMTLRALSSPTNSTYDDVTYSSSDSTVNGYFLVAGAELAQQTMGKIQVGDNVVYFKNDVSPNEGDQVNYNSQWYSITNIMPRYAGTTLVFTLCRLAPINTTP